MNVKALGSALMALPVGWAAAVTYAQGFNPGGITGLSAGLAWVGVASLVAGGYLAFKR